MPETEQWTSTYVYSGGESSHHLVVERDGGSFLAHSLPNEEGSELSLELTQDGIVLQGAWHETTSPAGAYKGAVFDGLVAFVLQAGGARAEGRWIGYNRDRTQIKSGEWILEKQSKLHDG
jgi:hypothetical protein